MQVVTRSWADLAIFGGEPAFSQRLHVGRPNIGNRERLFERINTILSRRWLTNDGICALELEQRICELLGVKHCTLICNGTVALEVSIRALGLSGEVIVPSFTFVATAHALQWMGVTPVFCDVNPQTHCIDPSQAERLITPQTTGIIGVHLWGEACQVEELSAIAQRHGIALLFDAAHAFACSHQARMIGNFGSLEVFSFHATKFFNTLEGGAVVTNDDSLAETVRAMRNFGFGPGDEVSCVGTNGKLNEFSAAMGLTGLECLADFIEINHRNYQTYQTELAGLPGIRCVRFDENERRNYQYVVIEIDETITGVTRDDFLRILHSENILARRYFYPGCHRTQPYRRLFPEAGFILPVTEMLAKRVLTLPTGTAVSVDNVRGTCEIIRLVVSHGEDVRERLRRIGDR